MKTLPEYPSIPRFVLLLFCGYVIIWYLQVGIRIPELGAIRVEMLYALTLIASMLFVQNVSFPKTPLTVPALLLLLVMLASIPFSCDVELSWNIFFNRAVKFSFMGIFIASFVKSPEALKFFLGSFLLACGKLGQEGVHGQLTGSLVWQNQGIMRLHGPTPLYLHPNSFSGMALGTIPFIIYLWKLAGWFVRIYLAALLFASTTIVLFTGSRTGYIAFLLMIALFVLRSRHRVKLVLIGAVLLVAAVNFMPKQYENRFMSTFTSYKNKNSSAGKRIEIIKDAIAIFKEYPLGVGVGAFPSIRMEKFQRYQDTHNLYLEILTNIGIQGFVIYLIFISRMLSLLRKLDRILGKQLDSLQVVAACRHDDACLEHCQDLIFMQAVSRAVFLFIWVRLGLGLFGHDLYEIYWWFSAGLTMALWQMNKVALHRTEFFLSSR